MADKTEMQEMKIDDIPEFSMSGIVCPLRLHSVYDGDTFRCALPICHKQFIFICRLYGIDTPEKRTRNAIEKKAGKQAHDFVKKQLTERAATIVCREADKYGRLLCDITFDDNNDDLATLLVNAGLAYRYDGGKKLKFDEWYVPKDDDAAHN